MRILITGICGFVGSEIALALQQHISGAEIYGIDNLSRPGSETNRLRIKKSIAKLFHGDVRVPSDFDELPKVDWLIDAAANPSVLAGVDGKTSSRQLVEHNLLGTVNMLEFCKRHGAGFALISTSRVYSVDALAKIPVKEIGRTFVVDPSRSMPAGCSIDGIATDFSTAAPVSLYGSCKLASEALALEYGHTVPFPVVINRCGVMAGGGQFGTADQGIFSFWIRSFAAKKPLKYIGFGGSGAQVRDAMDPRDLASLLVKQIMNPPPTPTVWNVGGGKSNVMSLAQLSDWCRDRFGEHPVQSPAETRRWDAPWIVMDAQPAQKEFGWQIETPLAKILDEIAEHHREHPEFLELST